MRRPVVRVALHVLDLDTDTDAQPIVEPVSHARRRIIGLQTAAFAPLVAASPPFGKASGRPNGALIDSPAHRFGLNCYA